MFREALVEKTLKAPDAEDGWVSRVRGALVLWYRAGHRSLPWRRDRDAYRVLVSEFMLVQTTAVAVVPYFERFLALFPSVRALASASEEEVLKAWEGLGYYRRARQLHEAARTIVAEHGGDLPKDRAALERLPGVGRYLAGAVLSFAFDQPEAILEANSQRVLARLLAWPEPLANSRSRERLWLAAGRLVPELGAGEFNQALIEIGATLCSARAPRCLLCPLQADCMAHTQGITDRIPAVPPRPEPLAVSDVCAVFRRGSEFLLFQRPEIGLWAGFWEFPTWSRSGANPARRAELVTELGPSIVQGLGYTVEDWAEPWSTTYSVTKHRVRVEVHEALRWRGELREDAGEGRMNWLNPQAVDRYPMTSVTRKILSRVCGETSRTTANRNKKRLSELDEREGGVPDLA
jgi:A/G-specific adenine glycosylase